jgi:hypothetical protein
VSIQHTCCWFWSLSLSFNCLIKLYIHTNFSIRNLSQYQWMYVIPLGLIVMNAVTQAMNMPEEQAGGGQAGAPQQPGTAVQRGTNPGVRRRW